MFIYKKYIHDCAYSMYVYLYTLYMYVYMEHIIQRSHSRGQKSLPQSPSNSTRSPLGNETHITIAKAGLHVHYSPYFPALELFPH